MKDTNHRGVLTDAIKDKYHTLTLKKLRLLPYLQYLIMNSMPVDPAKIDSEERAILSDWRDKGYISYSMTEPCACTRKFWNMMNDILFHTYVLELEGEPDEEEDHKHGHWVYGTCLDGSRYCHCSECDESAGYDYYGNHEESDFCPNCGAEMDEESEGRE